METNLYEGIISTADDFNVTLLFTQIKVHAHLLLSDTW